MTVPPKKLESNRLIDGAAVAVLAGTEIASWLLGWGLGFFPIFAVWLLAICAIYCAAAIVGSAFTVARLGELEQYGFEQRDTDPR